MPATQRGLLHQAFFNGNGLARRLIVALVLFSSALTAVITTLQLYASYRSDLQKIDESFQFIRASAAPVLVNSVWVTDNTQIETQLQGLLRLRDIEFVGIYVDGKLRWSAGTQTSTRLKSDRLQLMRPYRGQDVNIGEVRVSASLDNVWSRLFDQLIAVLIENGIKTLLVAAFMLLVVQVLITRHLAKLSTHARSLHVQGLEGEDVKLDRPETGRWRPDALDHLTQAINTMRQNLRSAYQEMRETNRRLQESEALLSGIVNNSSALIHVKDRDGRFLMINRPFERLNNISAAEIKGKSVHEIFPREVGDVLRANDLEVAKQNRAIEFEELVPHPDGPHIYLSTKFPLSDAEGNIYATAGISTDITDRKRAEEALKRLNDELELRVEQRTSLLLAAKDEAERASRAKSEFLSRMSHELRTPMNAILGFSQVLEVEPLSAEQHAFVREIHEAGDHLLELINDLLDLSRIESGRLETVVQPVPLRVAIEQAVQLVKPLLQQNELTLDNPCGHEVTVLADATRLKQILVNLLSNAAKYNRRGGSVRIECSLAGEESARISVTDTGPGIAPEKQQYLFQPFERLGAEFTAIEGSGIGLAISKRLVELMGGAIGVESAPGQGSTFWIELPLAHRAQQDAAAVPAAAPGVARDTRKILYVEDNAANLKVVEAMLRNRPNLTVLSATNGEYGLELAQRYRPDAILLDIHLPGMDGYAVLQALQAQADTCDIPVIALSADAMPLDVERGLAAGFKGYLTKPVKREELVDTLEQTLRERDR